MDSLCFLYVATIMSRSRGSFCMCVCRIFIKEDNVYRTISFDVIIDVTSFSSIPYYRNLRLISKTDLVRNVQSIDVWKSCPQHRSLLSMHSTLIFNTNCLICLLTCPVCKAHCTYNKAKTRNIMLDRYRYQKTKC